MSSTTSATDGAHPSRGHYPDTDSCKHVYHEHALKCGEICSQGVMDKAGQPRPESGSNSGGCLDDAEDETKTSTLKNICLQRRKNSSGGT